MSENTNNEDVVPAILSEGESVLPEGSIEKNKEVIEDLVEKYKEINDQQKEKAEEPKAVVEAPKPVAKPGLGFVGDGAMGSTVVDATPKPKPAPKAKKADTVAVYSSRNVTWSGVGKVYIGYNIVTKEAADQWITRDHARLATPEEVAQEFGL